VARTLRSGKREGGLCVVLLLINSVCVKLPLAKLPLAKPQPTFFGFFQPSSQLRCVDACEDVCETPTCGCVRRCV
jgi:hypothetical protein